MLPTLIVQEVDLASEVLPLCLIVVSPRGAPRFVIRTVLHG